MDVNNISITHKSLKDQGSTRGMESLRYVGNGHMKGIGNAGNAGHLERIGNAGNAGHLERIGNAGNAGHLERIRNAGNTGHLERIGNTGNAGLMENTEARWGKAAVEKAAQMIFRGCAFLAIAAVAFITLYMLVSGTPAVGKAGLKNILFETEWMPTAENPKYGIFFIILTSVVGTFLAVLISMPVGILTAVFLAEMADRRVAAAVRPAVELLAGIPSVIYGLLGIYLLNPLMYKLELKVFAGSDTHQFTGGANLLSAVLVLAIMILPTVISISEDAIRSVHPSVKEASLALGASYIQTIFKTVLPAAKPGIMTAAVLGVGRAMGEATAVTLVSGSSVNPPLPFRSVRFLTTAIVSEMGYSQGTHRQMLFTVGLVLFGLIMLVNIALNRILKKSG